MRPFQKILVPIDVTALNSNVLQAAAETCRRYEASATLLHVWEPELFSVPGSTHLYDPRQVPGWSDKFVRVLERARHDMQAEGALQIDVALAQGTPYREILRFAQEGSFDLIVIGTHGRAGLAHALLGSVAEKVVRLSHCPVLTVHLNGQELRSAASELSGNAAAATHLER